MKPIRLLAFLFAVSAALQAHAVGFTDPTGLRWELPPDPTRNAHADILEDACRNFKIGGRQSRLPTYKEAAAVERGGHASMSDEQKANFETTRNAAGQNWPSAEFVVLAKSGDDFWRAGLRTSNYNHAIKPNDFHSLTICVGDAKVVAKAPEKKPEPKSEAPSRPVKPLGPVLTRVPSHEQTAEQRAQQLAKAEADSKARTAAAQAKTKAEAEKGLVIAKAKEDKQRAWCAAETNRHGLCSCIKFYPGPGNACGK
ncbi:hypothetical protein SAMN05216567_11770 [Variovorax sp. OK605]|jgi:hypothetical protein|uniref:hypothetical protein n=1 Tax=unclassified Variovorax TaxID=663243 RepID=UPI0008C859CA|nr:MULTISPECIES: hypothetical protein [unclassified Variovorax]SEK14331.1 hypothetical protein SAMN05518853_11471 [Variovorax sp. OK202]SFD96945.1 hypothetical protein SAMN05444746_11471 [Variovorax sp. OK212]SFQ48942.1 hypothetical protein SAMN05216567_11770 [Variovorax sp. OK605]